MRRTYHLLSIHFAHCLLLAGCWQTAVTDKNVEVSNSDESDSHPPADTGTVDDGDTEPHEIEETDTAPATHTDSDTIPVSKARCEPPTQASDAEELVVIPPQCGDGQINVDGEECDDGNMYPGDGCNGLCKIEPGFTCEIPGEPCIVVYVCGNGVLEPGEMCDDGNTFKDDGCSDICEMDPRYECPIPGRSCILLSTCGDLRIEGPEHCEDGNPEGALLSGDGCDADCQVEPGWVCPFPGKPCIRREECEPACTFAPFCGDGILNSKDEVCDDGLNDGSYNHCSVDCLPGPRCGDGILQPAYEECDDGNTVSKDGCSAKCVPDGCGDGIVDRSINPATGLPYEECDDGINDGGYKECMPDCRYAVYCGDGIVQAEAGETCDDGVLDNSYGGCTPWCGLGPRCGDSLIQLGFEECDDPATGDAYPGCTACKKTYCGDGIVQAPFEMCDDGNRVDDDHCDNTCRCILP